MIGERFPSASTFAIPYSSRQSSSVSAPGDAHAPVTCCRGEFPSPQSIVHTYTTITQTPAQHSTLSIFVPPAMPCISVPCPYQQEEELQERQSKSASHPCIVSGRSRHHNSPRDSQDMQCSSVSSTDSDPANEHCHARKAHVSSSARQSRFCRRSQPRHPPYQPYRVCRRGPIVFWRAGGGWRCMHAYV